MRGRAARVGVISLVAAGAVWLVPVAGADPTFGTIEGSITDAASGQPLVSGAVISVTVYTLTDPANPVAGTSQDRDTPSADYALNLSPGTYYVGFSDEGIGRRQTGEYQPQWYGGGLDEASSTTVTVVAGGTLTGIDAAMIVGGRITGTVTDATTGDPIPPTSDSGPICIFAYASGHVLPSEFGTDSPTASVCQDRLVHGQYVLQGLPPGDYQVDFDSYDSALYLTVWYRDQPSQDTAVPVSVSAGATTQGIDEAMQRGGTISGNLTDYFTGQPVSNSDEGGGLYVVAYSSNTTAPADPFGAAVDFGVGDDGHYVLGPLNTGTYYVAVFSNDVSQYYKFAFVLSQATPVHATLGQDTPGVDMALLPGGPPPPPAPAPPGPTPSPTPTATPVVSPSPTPTATQPPGPTASPTVPAARPTPTPTATRTPPVQGRVTEHATVEFSSTTRGALRLRLATHPTLSGTPVRVYLISRTSGRRLLGRLLTNELGALDTTFSLPGPRHYRVYAVIRGTRDVASERTLTYSGVVR